MLQHVILVMCNEKIKWCKSASSPKLETQSGKEEPQYYLL